MILAMPEFEVPTYHMPSTRVVDVILQMLVMSVLPATVALAWCQARRSMLLTGGCP